MTQSKRNPGGSCPSLASQFAGKPSTRHRSIPPRNTDTFGRPASCSCCAAVDDRRSVLQTTTTGRFSRTRTGRCAGNSVSGMFVACLICPRGPVNSSEPRTSRIRGASSRSSRVASAAGSIHDGDVDAWRNQRDRNFMRRSFLCSQKVASSASAQSASTCADAANSIEALGSDFPG